MQYEIKGTPFPVVVCHLAANEMMCCQNGAMAWMSPNMQMSTDAGGSVGSAFRRAFSGEAMFHNKYIAQGAPGQIAFATTVPGNIIPIQITPERSVIAQKSAYLASEPTVEYSIAFQRRFGTGFFGGEGFIMQQFSGNGIVFLELDGSIIEYDLPKGESMLIDTGYLAAMDASCTMEIEKVKGVKNILFGGEGFFNTKLTGPGHVWLQTMPVSILGETIRPHICSNGQVVANVIGKIADNS